MEKIAKAIPELLMLENVEIQSVNIVKVDTLLESFATLTKNQHRSAFALEEQAEPINAKLLGLLSLRHASGDTIHALKKFLPQMQLTELSIAGVSFDHFLDLLQVCNRLIYPIYGLKIHDVTPSRGGQFFSSMDKVDLFKDIVGASRLTELSISSALRQDPSDGETLAAALADVLEGNPYLKSLSLKSSGIGSPSSDRETRTRRC